MALNLRLTPALSGALQSRQEPNATRPSQLIVRGPPLQTCDAIPSLPSSRRACLQVTTQGLNATVAPSPTRAGQCRGRRSSRIAAAPVLAPQGPTAPSPPPTGEASQQQEASPSFGSTLVAPPSAAPLSTIVAEAEEERRACALMRAQLLYPYPLPAFPSPPTEALRDADAVAAVYSHLEGRTKAEFARDSTLKQLGLPVLSFLVLSSSDEVISDALHRQKVWLQRAHPACKPLLACPDLSLPLGRESSGAFGNIPDARWHEGQTSNLKHTQHQQHELLLLHNGVGPRALALATLDLQLPGGPGDMPLGPSESMRLKKVQAQTQKSTFSSSFASWLGTGKVGHSEEVEEESTPPESEAQKGGYIFNLCVAQLFRRQGIARRLLCHVAAYARDVQGLDCLQMHAECANEAAVELYTSLGFRVQHVETEQDAATLRRPPRVLFRLSL